MMLFLVDALRKADGNQSWILAGIKVIMRRALYEVAELLYDDVRMYHYDDGYRHFLTKKAEKGGGGKSY
jgi:hypothetical protein